MVALDEKSGSFITFAPEWDLKFWIAIFQHYCKFDPKFRYSELICPKAPALQEECMVSLTFANGK